MDLHAYPVAKRRIEWSALFLFLLGIGSMASPHVRVPLHLQHHSGGSSSSSNSTSQRSSRQSSRRSASGGAQTELDRHGADIARASQGLRPQGESSALMAAAAAAAVVPTMFVVAVPESSGVGRSVSDDVVASSFAAKVSRGRAPPLV